MSKKEDFLEIIRISEKQLVIELIVSKGKDGDFFVQVSPTLNVSGYGKTEDEAKESFDLNIKLFCEDLMNLKLVERLKYIKSFGFKNKKYQTKNYSNIYVDKNGILQGLEQVSTMREKIAA